MARNRSSKVAEYRDVPGMTCQPRPVLSHFTESVLAIVVTCNAIGVNVPAVSWIGIWLFQVPPACAIATGLPPTESVTAAPASAVTATL